VTAPRLRTSARQLQVGDRVYLSPCPVPSDPGRMILARPTDVRSAKRKSEAPKRAVTWVDSRARSGGYIVVRLWLDDGTTHELSPQCMVALVQEVAP
jgi:hypothetical protein